MLFSFPCNIFHLPNETKKQIIQQNSQQALDRSFELADTDHNGVIDRSEYASIISSLNSHFGAVVDVEKTLMAAGSFWHAFTSR